MAGSSEEDKQHAANDEQGADSNGCQWGHRAALLGVLLFPCKHREARD